MLVSTSYTQQDQALDLVRGQKVLLPDFDTLLSSWPQDQSTDCSPQLRTELEKWMQSFTTDEKSARRLRSCNFGLLATSLWPASSGFAAETVLAKFIVWVFAWDDYFDERLDNPEALDALQTETKQHFADLFGAWVSNTGEKVQPINECFADIAAGLNQSTSLETRERFLESMYGYIDSVNVWNERCGDGSMPTFAEYYENRWLSSGIKPGVSLVEYAYGLDIAAEIFETKAMKEVINRTVEISMLLNDIVSVRKEIATGQLSNVIPVLAYQNNTNAQHAMDDAIDLINQAQSAFEEAERQLPIDNKDVKQLINGCKSLCTGYLNWSHQSDRYFGANPEKIGKRIVVQL